MASVGWGFDRVFPWSFREPQGRSNLMKVGRDCFAEFILSAAEGLAMTDRRTERLWGLFTSYPFYSQRMPSGWASRFG